tara:strand:- start:1831 stop:2535 length:705 start_codon:yes stop_codon:yes gene_type:complete
MLPTLNLPVGMIQLNINGKFNLSELSRDEKCLILHLNLTEDFETNVSTVENFCATNRSMCDQSMWADVYKSMFGAELKESDTQQARTKWRGVVDDLRKYSTNKKQVQLVYSRLSDTEVSSMIKRLHWRQRANKKGMPHLAKVLDERIKTLNCDNHQYKVYKSVEPDNFTAACRAVANGGPEAEGYITYYRPIELWDVSNIEEMSWAFSAILTINVDLSLWDVSSVRTMSYMFQP